MEGWSKVIVWLTLASDYIRTTVAYVMYVEARRWDISVVWRVHTFCLFSRIDVCDFLLFLAQFCRVLLPVLFRFWENFEAVNGSLTLVRYSLTVGRLVTLFLGLCTQDRTRGHDLWLERISNPHSVCSKRSNAPTLCSHCHYMFNIFSSFWLHKTNVASSYRTMITGTCLLLTGACEWQEWMWKPTVKC